ncbi:hypothetical protein [Paludibaculum fermentans]|uniref:hypothetical protein n=1 Tax=Paludibaculum fermentans TaxID=1473598 RepID=UPI003EBD1435
MKLVLIALASTTLQAQVPVASAETATVRIVVRDSFGRRGSDCRVLHFVVDTDATRAQLGNLELTDQPDYAGRFDGMVAHDIPYGEYIVDVRCARPDGAGGSFRSFIQKGEMTLSLAGYSWGGDDTRPGGRISLTARLSKNSGASSRAGFWIKAVGVFLERTEEVELDPAQGQAVFYHLEPGTYLFLLFKKDQLVCTRQIDLFRGGAQLEIDPGAPCKMESRSDAAAVKAEHR